MSDKTLENLSGSVALVGAGPGDPGLLTLRGRELLEQADVVLFDNLVSQKLRQYAQKATWIFAGKRAADHAMTQDQINQLLIEHARAGKRVVRLKGGDPFVFGRGGEECQALARAQIAFEVVPGITAAIAAAAYAGIPVTHRDTNSSVTLITGHEKEEEYRDGRPGGSADRSSDLDWSALAKLPCLAVYMGVKSLPRIALRLIEHGMAPDTPAACIERGTTPGQRTVTGTLADIADRAAAQAIGTPAVTIIGHSVDLRPTIRWFDTRPLFGQTVVVTRTRQQASELSGKLEQLGARVIEAPTIEIVAPADWSMVDAALNGLARSSAAAPTAAQWLLLTSPNAVEFTRKRLFDLNLDGRSLSGVRIGVIGAATRRAVEEQLCCRVDLCPEGFVSESLADALRDAGVVRGNRFLLLRAEVARPVLADRLRADGAADVADVAIYETRRPESLPPELLDALAHDAVDWITFTSSSTVRNLFEMLGRAPEALLKGVKLASIGPVTTQSLRDLGREPTVEANPYNIHGLVRAIVNHRRSNP